MMRSTVPFFCQVVIFIVCPVFAQSDVDLGSFKDYPVAEQVWLASVVGEVTVNPEFPIEANLPGELEWVVADGAEVEADQVLCLGTANKIKLSERDLELRKRRYSNSLSDLEWSYDEKRKSVEISVAETVVKLGGMELTPTERELLGNGFEKRLQEDRGKLENELKRLRSKLESDYFTRGFDDEKALLDLEIDNAEQAHTELLRSSEIRAEEAGVLTIERENVFKSSTVIGKVTKKGTAEAVLEMSDPRLRNVAPSNLSISIQGDDGKSYNGKYIRSEEKNMFQGVLPKYIFEISGQKGGEGVPEPLTGSRLFRVNMLLEEPGRMVPKGDLLFRFPDEINKDGWAAFIEKRWSDVKILYVGPRELIVGKKDEN